MVVPSTEAPRRESAAFLFFPNRYLHESRRAEMLPEPVWRLLADCPRTEGRLAGFVTERAGLGMPALEHIGPPKARFCLMPGPAVLNVAGRLGLALNAARLVRTIDGKIVSRLRRELGADAYEFALRRAPLIATHPDPMSPDFAATTSLAAEFERSGINYIGLALVDLDASVRERFKLRLPKDHAALLASPQGGVAPEVAWQVVRKIVREAEPEWSALLE